MSIKFSQLDDALNRLVQKIEKSPRDYTLSATKMAEGIFKERVFNVNGAKDINGVIVGRYSEGYLKYSKYGKKKVATNWDLHATGDLKDSIRVVTTKPKKRTVLQFADSEQIKKAEGLEDKSGKTIFEISPKERNQIIKETTQLMLRDIKKMIKESFK